MPLTGIKNVRKEGNDQNDTVVLLVLSEYIFVAFHCAQKRKINLSICNAAKTRGE